MIITSNNYKNQWTTKPFGIFIALCNTVDLKSLRNHRTQVQSRKNPMQAEQLEIQAIYTRIFYSYSCINILKTLRINNFTISQCKYNINIHTKSLVILAKYLRKCTQIIRLRNLRIWILETAFCKHCFWDDSLSYAA